MKKIFDTYLQFTRQPLIAIHRKLHAKGTSLLTSAKFKGVAAPTGVMMRSFANGLLEDETTICALGLLTALVTTTVCSLAVVGGTPIVAVALLASAGSVAAVVVPYAASVISACAYAVCSLPKAVACAVSSKATKDYLDSDACRVGIDDIMKMVQDQCRKNLQEAACRPVVDMPVAAHDFLNAAHGAETRKPVKLLRRLPNMSRGL